MAADPTLQGQEDFNNELQETRELALEIKNTFRGIGAEITDIINQKMKNLNGAAKTVARTIKEDIVKNLQSQAKETGKINELAQKQINGSIKVAEVEARITKTKEIHLRVMDALTEALMEGTINQDTFNKKVNEATTQFQKQQDALNKMKEKAEEFEKKLGLSYKIFKGLADIPIIGKFIDLKKVTEEMEEAVSKGASSTQAFGVGINATFKSIGKSLKDPLVSLGLMVAFYKKILDLAYSHNQLLTDTGKQLALSKDQVQEIYKSNVQYASSLNNSFITGTKLLESQIQLNDALGTAVTYSNESVEAFTRLTQLYGLSAEQAGELEKLGQLQGKNSKEVLNGVIKTTAQQKLQFGGTIKYQEVLKKVSATSGDILTRFKGNTEALTAAVMQADRLGLTLEQVNKIGESLLNFESSIENELKAELLTGKAINLEKARAAALSGDTVTLTKEIANQVGNIHKFEKMNVIQRQAYAEAFGMTADEMGDMLRKQEFEAKLGAMASKSAREQLEYARKNNISMTEAIEQQLEQRSLADMQRDVFKQIQDILNRLVSGPMNAFLKIIEKVLKGVSSIFDIFGKMTGGIGGDAIGAVLLALPAAIMAFRGLSSLFGGGLKGMLFSKGTDANPMVVRNQEEGLGDMLSDFGGGGKRGIGSRMKRGLVGKFGAKGTRNLIRGAKGFGIGAAVGIGADLISDQMDEGTGKDTVSGIGTAASWAGTGAMIGSIGGPVGTAIGAGVGVIAGSIKALFDAERNAREREDKEKQTKEEQQKRTNELLQQFIDRPIQLNVGGKTILDFNTASNLYGTQQSSFS